MHSIIPFPRFTSRPSGRCIRGGVVRHRLYRFDREPDGKLECLRTRPSMYSPPESLSNILLQQEINFMGTTIDDTLSIPPTFAILYYISYTIKSIYSKLPYLLITANKFILFISTKSIYIYIYTRVELRCWQTSMLIIRTGKSWFQRSGRLVEIRIASSGTRIEKLADIKVLGGGVFVK